MKIKRKIFQFAYIGTENEVESITFLVEGAKKLVKKAKVLWYATLSLSNAEFSNKDLEKSLVEDGFEDEEIEYAIETFANDISPDLLTAYDQCISKIKELGVKVIEIADEDGLEVDVYTSYGVY